MKKILGTLSLALLVGFGALVATPAHASRPAARPAVTAVTLDIAGCNGCRVSASSWMRLHTTPWTSVTRTVHHGRVTFYPPTGRTKGLTFAFTDMHAVNNGAVPQTVMRYASLPAAHAVTSRQARASQHGYVCWAGTTRRTAALHLTVDRFADTGLAGDKGYSIRVYADPTVRTVGTRRQLWKGTYETQDIPLCFG